MGINKVQYGNTVLIDLTDATATADKILQGYTAYGRDGSKLTGTATGGGSGDGYVWQDAQGYVHLSDEEGTQTTIDALTVNASGTYTAPTGHAYSPVTVPSGSATTPTTSISVTPSISVNSSGLITASASGSKSVTPTVSAGWVSSGTAGTVSVSGSNTSQLSTQAGATITPTTSEQTAVAAGKYTTGAVKVAAMPSGTEGTPTATKGTVSNHSISVTPSVTNTAGYISGGTKTGTAVTVSASELVSGTKSISANGTDIDVTNYAFVDVAVPSSAPTLITKSITANGTYNASSDSADGYSSVTVNVSGGGGGGLVYEAGTWTPSENISSYWIPFANTHTEAPFYFMLADASTSYNDANNANLMITYSNMEQAFGNPVNGYTETTQHYGMIVYQYRGSSGSLSYSRINLTTSASDTADTVNNNSRYWTTETGFRAYTVSGSRYWLSTRTYKWIAIWAPTT